METMDRIRTIRWNDPEINKRDAISSMSGLDYLRSVRDGTLSPPPVAGLVGYRIFEVSKGFAAFELEPAEYHYNPFATVHGGILSTLLDTTMTASVLSALPPHYTCTTIEIKVNFVKPVFAQTGILRCEAKPVHLGKRMATAEGRLKSGDGALHAHGTSTCSIIKTGCR